MKGVLTTVPGTFGYMPVQENANPIVFPCAEMSASKIALYVYNRSGVVSCQKTSICINLSLQWSLHPCRIPTVTLQLRPPPRLPFLPTHMAFITKPNKQTNKNTRKISQPRDCILN